MFTSGDIWLFNVSYGSIRVSQLHTRICWSDDVFLLFTAPRAAGVFFVGNHIDMFVWNKSSPVPISQLTEMWIIQFLIKFPRD